ncbi:putative lipopolysaccharide heptosyltransferase III [Candidatus Magnetaquicoccus inordinatus]|uniref:putative lipopolysaccharide heptosyltransferase III n=1 Tax=Candidatus Magnetaquicoccus inordinatus TaxID=2496818 RepID=UPI00102BCF4A|nr:putative lipopolysaccharide heptosyltransferase III [Candidatus Magnetaquicoccus inordinatus]
MSGSGVKEPARILVIKSRHIGDVLLTGPLLSTLQRRHPAAQISILVKADCATIMEGHPHLSKIFVFPQRQANEGSIAFFWRAWCWLRELRRSAFDWVINTTEGDRGVITAFLTGAPRRLGLRSKRRRREKWWRRPLLTDIVYDIPGSRHRVIRNLDLIGAGEENRGHRVELTTTAEDWAEVRRLLLAQGWDGQQPLVQVHPPSRWMFKCWSDQGMAGVITHLQARGYAVVLTSAPLAVEKQKNTEIIKLCSSPPFDLSGQLSLAHSAALTAHCQLFFGVDTAPAHMAAALDIPVVVLFGPSGVQLWGPWPNGWSGQGTPYPQLNGVQWAEPHVVIQKNWDCVPCGRDGCEGSKISRCLQELTLEEVLPHLERVLEQRAVALSG